MQSYTRHHVSCDLAVEGEVNPRFEDPPAFAKMKWEGFYRCIGGDKGDILFNSYTVDNGKTTIDDAHLLSCYLDSNSTQEEVDEMALEIFDFAVESIGLEVVY